MAEAIHVPRINNNDDEVKLVELQVAVGSHVTQGQVVAQVETDKAIVDVEAGADGYVLAILGAVDDVVKVGKQAAISQKMANFALPICALSQVYC